MMCELDSRYPGYGFAAHKGYSTPVHQAALDEHGPCPEHRMSYANVPRSRPVEAAQVQDTGRPIVGQNGEGSARPAQGDLLDFGAIAGAGS